MTAFQHIVFDPPHPSSIPKTTDGIDAFSKTTPTHKKISSSRNISDGYKTQNPPDQEKLDQLIQRSHHVFMKIHSVFPFDFFPDMITVDENKVDIVIKDFFLTQRIYSVLIKNINAVSVAASVLFATLAIEVTGYEQNPPEIHFLWKPEARRIRRIILGLVACSKEGIDTTTFPPGELTRKVEEIGSAKA